MTWNVEPQLKLNKEHKKNFGNKRTIRKIKFENSGGERYNSMAIPEFGASEVQRILKKNGA